MVKCSPIPLEYPKFHKVHEAFKERDKMMCTYVHLSRFSQWLERFLHPIFISVYSSTEFGPISVNVLAHDDDEDLACGRTLKGISVKVGNFRCDFILVEV